MYLEEHGTLRMELNNLKNCQVTFLTFSVTATGVLIGIIKTFSNVGYELLLFVPLFVLLPAWSIFFDKAKTISRIVGYYRIIEQLILNNSSTNNFAGWENSLQIFRNNKKDEAEIKKVAIDELRERLGCNNRYHISRKNLKVHLNPFYNYWTLVNSIFLFLTSICVAITILTVQLNVFLNLVIIGLVLLVVVVTAYYNIRTLCQLLCGIHSYEANERFWRKILQIT